MTLVYSFLPRPYSLWIVFPNHPQLLFIRRNRLSTIRRQSQLPSRLLLYLLNSRPWMIRLEHGFPVLRVKGKNCQGCNQRGRAASWQTYSFTPCRSSKPFFTWITIAGTCHIVYSLT